MPPVRSSTVRPKVSGIVTCFNEQDNVEACIDSMSWCDEIVVVDSFSTDGTFEALQRRNDVRAFQRPYLGGASQKNWAIGEARFDWIFLLDADERCPAALRDEILSVLASNPDRSAFAIRRRIHFLGRRIRYSGWQNDRVVRLFRKRAGCYENRRVHSRLVTAEPAPLLNQPIEHYMVDNFHEYVRRLEKYAYWGAAQYWVDGRPPSRPAILVRPAWRFLRNYVLRGGFLDGARGLTFCLVQSYATFVKWALLWSWYVDARRGIQPELPEFDRDPSVWSGLDRLAARRTAGPSRTRPG